jgi:conjugative transposon TraK protein
MEFKSLTNIESSFRQIRFFGIVFICLCASVTGYSVWSAYRFAEAQRQKIYVLDEGKSLMLALSQDMAQNRPVEAREHIRRFHELFFTLAPEKSAIENNVRRALLMSDRSAFNYYRDLSERGFYNRIISTGANQTIQVDSISCDFNQYPYRAVTYARQVIIRESNLTERSLITRCRLINSVRSENSPHGFTLEGFEVVENKDVRVINR